ncbi:MAG: CBS domain-containing protein [Erysipelotrichaceae bacterium]|nr:CBS domain-containing protein [Erysipelotrichaceae bacterium]
MEKTNVLLLLTPKNEVACLNEKMNVRQAIEKMRAHGYRVIPLISRHGEYLGTISEGDILWHIVDEEDYDLEELESVMITELLRKDYAHPVKVDAGIDELAEQIVNANFVPVVDDRNVLMGIVTRRRVLQELLDSHS